MRRRDCEWKRWGVRNVVERRKCRGRKEQWTEKGTGMWKVIDWSEREIIMFIIH